MKYLGIVVPVLVALTISSGASAGNFEPQAIVDTIPQAAATDWSGFYVGALAGSGSSTIDAYNSDVFQSQFLSEGGLYGGFAGYNFQSGNLVYGGEISYLAGEIADPNDSHTVSTDHHTDLKLRVGYSAGDFLLFGFGGYSTMTMNEGISVPVTIDGFNYGAGAEILINNRYIIGADYTVRNASGNADPIAHPTITVSGPVNSFSVRAGIKF